MVHSPHKGTVVAEDSFNLRGVGKLKFSVNITTMFDRPPLIDMFVDGRSIGPQFRSRLHFAEEKVPGMMLLGRNTSEDIKRELPRAFCFAMMRVISLKYASSICTIRSKIWLSSGRWARNRPYHRLTQSSESFVSDCACLMGICIVHAHRSVQNVW
jgi:hypothetical protein